ncbi:MAG: hypothetical protein PHD48_07370 [Alphaproteobacteria bacterium]|nr:hypothetical protein [Alphaproteobacteria bacterium]
MFAKTAKTLFAEAFSESPIRYVVLQNDTKKELAPKTQRTNPSRPDDKHAGLAKLHRDFLTPEVDPN